MQLSGSDRVTIVGGGMTGLAAGWASGFPVYEAAQSPGGICSSYYLRRSGERSFDMPSDEEAYRFELGGGHWIFGGDPAILRLLPSLVPMKSYQRRAAVFFRRQNLYVPYPLQNHLGHLGKEVAVKALTEMVTGPKRQPRTMAEGLLQDFGPTLMELFFAPFHELYTAGLWTQIAPQDGYKSPSHVTNALQGAFDETPAVGYNTTYVYPEEGMNALAARIAERGTISYGKQVVKIEAKRKNLFFSDGSEEPYNKLICTLPLNKTLQLAQLETDEKPDPYTSVLVLNIGAARGANCPDYHWVYIPDGDSGFHRVGFYSNVDSSFLPNSSRVKKDCVSLYVEKAYLGGRKPSPAAVKEYSEKVTLELQKWGYIGQEQVVDPTWIDVAYTWAWPESRWRSRALQLLEENNIVMVGRYARWVFQGIADSIRDGLLAGTVELNIQSRALAAASASRIPSTH